MTSGNKEEGTSLLCPMSQLLLAQFEGIHRGREEERSSVDFGIPNVIAGAFDRGEDLEETSGVAQPPRSIAKGFVARTNRVHVDARGLLRRRVSVHFRYGNLLVLVIGKTQAKRRATK